MLLSRALGLLLYADAAAAAARRTMVTPATPQPRQRQLGQPSFPQRIDAVTAALRALPVPHCRHRVEERQGSGALRWTHAALRADRSRRRRTWRHAELFDPIRTAAPGPR